MATKKNEKEMIEAYLDLLDQQEKTRKQNRDRQRRYRAKLKENKNVRKK